MCSGYENSGNTSRSTYYNTDPYQPVLERTAWEEFVMASLNIQSFVNRSFICIVLVLTMLSFGCSGGSSGGDGGSGSGEEVSLSASIDSPLNNTTIDPGFSVYFQGSGKGGAKPLNYSWDFGGGASASSSRTPGSKTFNLSGTYTVTLTVTDQTGVNAYDSIVVTVRKTAEVEEEEEEEEPVPDVVVPPVTGMTESMARSTIIGAGLATGTVSTSHSTVVDSGCVINQNPAAGALIPSGSVICLVVSDGPPPAPVSVPGVVGKTQAAAQAAISSAHLSVGTVTQDFSDTVAAGSVISQSPSAGTSVSQGSSVNMVISLGPSSTVPNVVNQTQSDAGIAIDAAGLDVGTVTTAHSDMIDAGNVVSQNPAAGSTVAQGSSVNMVISLGPIPQVIVPDVVNMTQADATTAVINADLFKGATTSDYSDTVAAGSVISQDPSAGTSVSQGSSVNMVISLGPSSTVPNVVNQTQSDAGTAINAAGLVEGTVTTAHSDMIDAGNVISQNPAAGSTVAQGSSVDLVISLGPAPQVIVPDVVNMTQSDAGTAIDAAGLVEGAITTAYSDTINAGNIISQDPAAGSSVEQGSSVDMVVSLGSSSQIDVPDVVGMTEAAAGAALNGAGLTIGTTSTGYSQNVPAGSVISQDPAAGSSVPDGSAVDIVVSLGTPQIVMIPDLTGSNRADAVDQLKSLGLCVGVMHIDYDNAGYDTVIQTDPPSGYEVEQGTPIDLSISLGPEVPNMAMYHKGVNINEAGCPTDSIWKADHDEPYSSGSQYNAQSEYLYVAVPDNITDWSGTLVDVPSRELETEDNDVLMTETSGLRGTVTQDGVHVGEITMSSVVYVIQAGDHSGKSFAKASWEILMDDNDRMAGQIYMTCYDFYNNTDVWGRVEGDWHGVYHADSALLSVFSRVEIISIEGTAPDDMHHYDIQWGQSISETESVYADNCIYRQEGMSWKGTGTGNYMNGDLDLIGDYIYLPFFNAGIYTGAWDLEVPDSNPCHGNYSGDMFSYLYLCGQGNAIVPLVEGLSELSAQYIIEDNMLTLGTLAEYISSTVPVGNVISQTPDVGTETPENGTVDIVVSMPTSNWASVSAGSSHTLAVDTLGRLWAWGANEYGQLGTDDKDPRPGPVMISSDTDWQKVSAGMHHSLAIKDGNIWSWGENNRGQLGRDGDTDKPMPVDGDGHWVAVSAGARHSVAINEDKSLWSWGDNISGQLGLGDTVEMRDTPGKVDDSENWYYISSGDYHSLGIADRTGKVYAWGSNECGQIGNGYTGGTTYVPVQVDTAWFQGFSPIEVHAGGAHSMAIVEQEQQTLLFAWGGNEFGQLGLGDNQDKCYPMQVGQDNTWKVVSAGGFHTLAAKTDGTFWVWGDNMSGQLGTGGAEEFLANPAVISSMINASAFSAGGLHSACIKTDEDDDLHGNNAMWTWGDNSSGQLGNRTLKDKPEPDRI